MRRRGLATLLVHLLQERVVAFADYLLESSIPFWHRFGTVTRECWQARLSF